MPTINKRFEKKEEDESMFCTFCKKARPANEAPCPNCGAPSSLPSQEYTAGGGAASSAPWSNGFVSQEQIDQQVPQLSFDTPITPFQGNARPGKSASTSQSLPWSNPQSAQPFSPPSSAQNGWSEQQSTRNYWSQEPPKSESEPGKALLPVPYQGDMQMQPVQPTATLQLISPDMIEQMLPGLPIVPDPVHVPPIYTKPRSIISRKRAVNGLLSVLIMTLLLCSGTVYLAQATGKIAAIGNFIYAATTTAHIDKMNNPIETDTEFKTKQVIHVTYVLKLANKGTVRVRWYSNGTFYKETQQSVPKPKLGDVAANGDAQIIYTQPAEGSVELYWNNQLAQTLYFVVNTKSRKNQRAADKQAAHWSTSYIASRRRHLQRPAPGRQAACWGSS